MEMELVLDASTASGLTTCPQERACIHCNIFSVKSWLQLRSSAREFQKQLPRVTFSTLLISCCTLWSGLLLDTYSHVTRGKQGSC